MSDVMDVKVTKTGNSKCLPLPAAIARATGLSVGDEYAVEQVGDDIIYHRKTRNAVIAREAGQAYAVLSSGSTLPVADRSSIPSLDWDF